MYGDYSNTIRVTNGIDEGTGNLRMTQVSSLHGVRI